MNRDTHPSTQGHINIGRIQDGVVMTKDGGLRLILMVSAVNFALKSEQEQNALIFQYQNFLNSLTFPIQIVIQSRQLDLSGYLATLENRLMQETNELLQIQTGDYIDFVKRLISLANIMDKKFFLVIPYDLPNLKSRSFFDNLLHPNKKAPDVGLTEFNHYREELLQRANIVMAGLSPLGLRSIPLDTQQLIELFYQTFNPEEAGKEKLTDEEALVAPLIEETPADQPGVDNQAPTEVANG